MEAPPEARDHRHRGHQLHHQPDGCHLPCACRKTAAAASARSRVPSPSPARRWMPASCGRRSTRWTARWPSRCRWMRCRVIWELQRGFTRWLLARPGAVPAITTAVERYHDGFSDIRAGEGILPPSQRPAFEGQPPGLAREGLPAALPTSWRRCRTWSQPEHHRAGARAQTAPVDVAKVVFRLADALREPWLRAQIEGAEGGRSLARGGPRRAARRAVRAVARSR